MWKFKNSNKMVDFQSKFEKYKIIRKKQKIHDWEIIDRNMKNRVKCWNINDILKNVKLRSFKIVNKIPFKHALKPQNIPKSENVTKSGVKESVKKGRVNL